MVVVDRIKDVMALEVRGKYGRPIGLGAFLLGWNHLGDEDPLSGYFYVRKSGIWGRNQIHALIGFVAVGENELGNEIYIYKKTERPPQKIVLRLHYWPDNFAKNSLVGTLNIGQNFLGEDYFLEISWQQVFANGVASWHDLTTAERLHYTMLRYPTGQSGFTRYMSEYLREHRT
jgi:hypothetical protein